MEKTRKVSVCLLIKDGANYLKWLDNMLSNIKEEFKSFELEIFIYENNSHDNTKSVLKNLYNNHKGKFVSEEIPNSHTMIGISTQRGKHMCNLRNKLKDIHGCLESEYTLLLDCDVIFASKTLSNMIDKMDSDASISMLTPFSICWDHHISNPRTPHHYYDSLALISKNDISWKTNGNTCIFDTCQRCIIHRYIHNINIDDIELLSETETSEVNSAFGGFALIRTHIYNKIFWEPTICEHHSFCKNARQFGKVVIDPSIKTVSTILKLSNSKEFSNAEKLLNKCYY